METRLRDSVSNWIVGGTVFSDDDNDTLSNVLVSSRRNGTFSSSSSASQFSPKQTSSSFHTSKIKTEKPELLGKRSHPTQEIRQQTVNPADIFSTIQSFTRGPSSDSDFFCMPEETDMPLVKKQKLNESVGFLSLFEDFLPGFQDSGYPSTALGFPLKSEVVSEPVIEDLLQDPLVADEDDDAEEAEEIEDVGDHREVEIRAALSFGKRGNGNQPWQTSCVAPPKIGKMRRVSVHLTSNSPRTVLLQVRARTIDQQPHKHKGKLVLCSDDRCCVKSKVEGQSKPVIKCAQRLSVIDLPQVQLSSSQPCTVDFYLKPEWNGLGSNKTRPSFDVVVELIDCKTEAIHDVIAWDTELQSHKFESSHKAKSMESSGRSAKFATTILLD